MVGCCGELVGEVLVEPGETVAIRLARNASLSAASLIRFLLYWLAVLVWIWTHFAWLRESISRKWASDASFVVCSIVASSVCRRSSVLASFIVEEVMAASYFSGEMVVGSN